MQPDTTFEIALFDIIMTVTSHFVARDEAFRIELSEGRPPLVVHEALRVNCPLWAFL